MYESNAPSPYLLKSGFLKHKAYPARPLTLRGAAARGALTYALGISAVTLKSYFIDDVSWVNRQFESTY